MELFLFILGAMLGIATFGFIVSQIKNDVVRYVTLGFGCIMGFFGFLISLISMA